MAIDRSRSPQAPPGIRLHRLADLDDKVVWNVGPPRVRIEHAVLDLAAESRDELEVIAILADAVQSRHTTAERLITTLDDRGRIARRRFLRAVLGDVADGTRSVLEHGFLTRVERPHGLPTAARQVRASSRRVIFRDVEYRRFGRYVELDGRLFHDSARARDLDLDRDLEAELEGKATTRLGWGQVFGRPCLTGHRLGLLLQVGVPHCRSRSPG